MHLVQSVPLCAQAFAFVCFANRTYAAAAGLLAWSGRRCLSWLLLSPPLALAAHRPQAQQAGAAELEQQLQAATQAAQQAQQEAQDSAEELAAERQARQAEQVRRRRGIAGQGWALHPEGPSEAVKSLSAQEVP